MVWGKFGVRARFGFILGLGVTWRGEEEVVGSSPEEKNKKKFSFSCGGYVMGLCIFQISILLIYIYIVFIK